MVQKDQSSGVPIRPQPALFFMSIRPIIGGIAGKVCLLAMPKEKIHPEYAAVRVLCACGNNFETRSTHKGDIHVEICSVCHPFFTGKQRLVDTAGRVERFRRKYAKAEPAK